MHSIGRNARSSVLRFGPMYLVSIIKKTNKLPLSTPLPPFILLRLHQIDPTHREPGCKAGASARARSTQHLESHKRSTWWYVFLRRHVVHDQSEFSAQMYMWNLRHRVASTLILLLPRDVAARALVPDTSSCVMKNYQFRVVSLTFSL